MSTIINHASDDDDDDDSDNDHEMKTDTNNDNNYNKEKFEENVKEFRDKLSQNPNNYDYHLNLLNYLSNNIEYINQFRKSRDKMYKKFAIPPSVSINFINVEIKYLYHLCKDNQIPTNKQINVIIQLFKNAINDYSFNIDLWLNYLEFVIQYQSIIGIKFIRKNIINEAISTIGHHFYQSHKVKKFIFIYFMILALNYIYKNT